MVSFVIKGGKIVTPDSILETDLLIENGKIAKIGEISSSGKKTIDASGLFILPGAIDGHVHFREPEDKSKEDFSTGSASALSGGVTTVIDMPCYRNPTTSTISAYSQKQKIAKARCRCDYQLRFGATESNFLEAKKSNAPSLKIFLTETGSELSCSKEAAINHMKTFPKEKSIVVHAEDAARIEARKNKFSKHEEIRDKKVAWLACEFVLKEAAKLNRRIHICHVTTKLEVQMCRGYEKATYEINPAHLYLCADDLRDLGFLGKINPPLRDNKERALLWHAIGDDSIIASDHAPHAVSHKKAGSPGYPGVGTLLPLMLQAVHEHKLDLKRVSRICSLNPASAFQLPHKGLIAPGFDADLVFVDMKKKWKIRAKNRMSKCNWTPFEGKEVYGKIEKVFLRGALAYDGEKVLAKPGNGKEVL